jgi:hypothetical protein
MVPGRDDVDASILEFLRRLWVDTLPACRVLPIRDDEIRSIGLPYATQEHGDGPPSRTPDHVAEKEQS